MYEGFRKIAIVAPALFAMTKLGLSQNVPADVCGRRLLQLMHVRPTVPTLSWAIVFLLLLTGVECSRDDASKSRTPDRRSASQNSPEQNKALARSMVREDYARWNTSKELKCLDQLWYRESHWNHRAVNERTGACGIPQSYPCNKMKGMGDKYGVDYRRNPWPQIAWGLQYIEERYGSPCAAWTRLERGSGY
jgi:hypothetical protein